MEDQRDGRPERWKIREMKDKREGERERAERGRKREGERERRKREREHLTKFTPFTVQKYAHPAPRSTLCTLVSRMEDERERGRGRKREREHLTD